MSSDDSESNDDGDESFQSQNTHKSSSREPSDDAKMPDDGEPNDDDGCDECGSLTPSLLESPAPEEDNDDEKVNSSKDLSPDPANTTKLYNLPHTGRKTGFLKKI